MNKSRFQVSKSIVIRVPESYIINHIKIFKRKPVAIAPLQLRDVCLRVGKRKPQNTTQTPSYPNPSGWILFPHTPFSSHSTFFSWGILVSGLQNNRQKKRWTNDKRIKQEVGLRFSKGKPLNQRFRDNLFNVTPHFLTSDSTS